MAEQATRRRKQQRQARVGVVVWLAVVDIAEPIGEVPAELAVERAVGRHLPLPVVRQEVDQAEDRKAEPTVADELSAQPSDVRPQHGGEAVELRNR